MRAFAIALLRCFCARRRVTKGRVKDSRGKPVMRRRGGRSRRRGCVVYFHATRWYPTLAAESRTRGGLATVAMQVISRGTDNVRQGRRANAPASVRCCEPARRRPPCASRLRARASGVTHWAHFRTSNARPDVPTEAGRHAFTATRAAYSPPVVECGDARAGGVSCRREHAPVRALRGTAGALPSPASSCARARGKSLACFVTGQLAQTRRGARPQPRCGRQEEP